MNSGSLAAVVGCPVGHSLSPAIFSAFGAALGRRLDYRALEISPESLSAAVRAAREDPRWIGWNVTLPHKVALLDHLDALDDSARPAKAVNVVRFIEGRALGYNTDSEGFLAPLRRREFDLSGKRAVVLGAGGAARAVCAALSRSGALRVDILNRTLSKASALAAEFGWRAGGADPDTVARAAAEAELLVNATPVGMNGRGSLLPRGARLLAGALAYDLVYRPVETPFLARAREAGARTLGGLEMLVAQAAATWRLWFCEDAPPDLLSRVESDIAGRCEDFLSRVRAGPEGSRPGSAP